MRTLQHSYRLFCLTTIGRMLLLLIALSFPSSASWAQDWSKRFDKQHPLIIVGDWDKPPYEFLDENGTPTGSNIDIMREVFSDMGIEYRYVLKEWSTAIRTFERGQADLILSNFNRYRNKGYYCSENIINYNRLCAASIGDSAQILSHKLLKDSGVVLKTGDYTDTYFRDIDDSSLVDHQTPRVALIGVKNGDYKYFVWGEEPLKWKIREFNIEGLVLNDVELPVSEICIVGRDKALIDEIDDRYSRLKQRGDIQTIKDRWMHPERINDDSQSIGILIILGIVILVVIFILFNRLAKIHVKAVTRTSTELNKMMAKALHMGNFHIMEYDIRNDLMVNLSGNILPKRGITLEEFTSHIHPSQQAEFRQKAERLLNGREKKFELDKRWRTFGNQGEWLNLQGHAIVEMDEEGKPAYVINAVNDVTRDLAEDKAKREMDNMYNSLLNIPFMALSFYDKNGYLIGLNDAMRDLCGINRNDHETARFWETVSLFDIPLFRSCYSPEDRDPIFVCQHMQYADMGIDHYIKFFIRPLFNQKGELTNYIVAALDVTNEHDRDRANYIHTVRTRELLAQAELYKNRLKFMLEKDRNFLWSSDMDSGKWHFYRTLDEDVDVPLDIDTSLAYMSEDERAEVLSVLTNPLPNQKPFSQLFHYTHTVQSNAPACFIISGWPVFNEDGSVKGHKGLSREVTDVMLMRQQLEKETHLAQEIGRLKSVFMASMTHELRTPLNAIIGFTDVLKSMGQCEGSEEYIRIIRTNCDMLRHLINDILTDTSLSANTTIIKATDVDFSKSFDDICLILQQRMQSGVAFIKDNPYETFPTRIDMGRIDQVITNLVSNAIKFTKEGHIRVGYRYERQSLYIYCEDTGQGIPKNRQKVIFDRFVKLDEYSQGTGMGLAICKSIVERCGGQIGVVSQGIGTGSTFWFSIPCKPIAPLPNFHHPLPDTHG